MKRGLVPSVVGAASLAAALGAIAAVALSVWMSSTTAFEQIGRFAVAPITNEDARAACLADPSRFPVTTPEGVRVDAYDAATLAPTGAGSPPVDARLLDRLRGGEDVPGRLHLFGPWGGAFLVKSADSGPCTLFMLRWPQEAFVRRRAAMFLLLSLVVALSIAAAVGLVAAGRLRRSLDVANARIREDARLLHERSRALEHHLRDVAHDLKTPLASLQLALEEASRGAADEDASALLHRALEDVVYLSALTENLRLKSGLEQGAFADAASAQADLAEIVERVAGRLGLLARRKGVSLDVARPDEAVLVACDPILLEQAVCNVAQNAVAYCARGDHVALVLEAHDGAFTLVVADDGPGVPAEELWRLGEETFRTDEARRRDPRGSGLGLHIAREVARRAGFRLAFEAGDPKGLVATLRGATSEAAGRS